MNKTLLFTLLLPIMLQASEQKKAYAEYIGHELWKFSLDSLDPHDIVKGIQEATQKIPPKMSREEAFLFFCDLEKEKFEKLAADNLAQSVDFLEGIKAQEGVVAIVADRVYIQILSEGTGEGLAPHQSGLFKLKASRPDEPPFYENSEPVLQSLDAAIQGFAQGAVGMKVGEKRMIYAHPDYAYGTDNVFHPNQAVMIEAERVAS